MKRLLPLLLLLASPAWATTYYVDSGCTTNCDGTAIDCGTGGGCSGPFTTLQNALAVVACGSGNIINVRGVHGTHASNHAAGTTDGRYGAADGINITKACAAGTAITIQGYGWTAVGAGTQEAVYIDGTGVAGTAGTSGWTQCTWDGSACDCDAGHLNISGHTSGSCAEIWYTDKLVAGRASGTNRSIWAQQPNGSTTIVQRPSTCNGSELDAQFKSCSAQADGSFLLVRWGTVADAPGGANNPKPYVAIDNNGNGIVGNGSSYVTVQGLTVRATRRAAISLSNAADDHVTIRDNVIKYIVDTEQNGSDYGIVSNNGNNHTFDYNEIAYTGSEAIHTQAHASAVTVLTITNNYIHDTDDQAVMGAGAGGTPSGMILGDAGGGAGNGDYTGSVVSGNIIKNTGKPTGYGSSGRGIILENNSSNWVIRDNIFDHVHGECLKLDANGADTNGNAIFNNIFKDCGYGGGGVGSGIYFFSGGVGKDLDGNKVYNNTFIDMNGDAIDETCGGRCVNNVIRNNLFYKSGSWLKQMVWADTEASNVFEYNETWGPNIGGNDAVRWKNTLYTCAGISGAGTGNICSDQVLVNASSDYHIQTSSPAKDAGTATGMPAARTTDITNAIAALRGYADYNDADAIQGGTWDIGADEFFLGGSPKVSGKVAATGKVTIQ